MSDHSTSELRPRADELALDRLPASLVEGLRPLLAALARKITIEELAVGSGLLQRVRIDQVQFGGATVDRLVIAGATAHLRSASAYLQNVNLNLELRLSLEWWYDLGIFGGDSGTESLGSLRFGLPVGNVLVPSLANLDLYIPSAAVTGLSASVPPLTNLELGPTQLAGVSASKTTLPSDGLAISGLGLGAVALDGITLPGASVRTADLEQLRPSEPIALPSVNLSNVSIPATSIPNIVGGAFAFDAQATSRGVSVDFGIFGLTFLVTPIAHLQVGALTLGGVNLSADVDSISLQGIRVPVDVRGVHIQGIQLNQITVEDIKL